MRYLSQLPDEYLNGKACLLRINLDIKDPTKESNRVTAIVPTIKFLNDKRSSITVISHRGRPEGKKDSSLSLKLLIKILQKESGINFNWLENLRFDPREQGCDKSFAKELARGQDFFVNDDFATSHRACASTVEITKILPSFAGLLLEKELDVLSKVRDNPEKPLVVIIGGNKIDDKIAVIDSFKNKADYILMGSAYLEARDWKPEARKRGKIIFAEDFFDNTKLDIGPKTITKFEKIILSAKTIIWNGPLGKFEEEKYAAGSKQIARAIIKSGAFSVLGGGDTGQFISQVGLNNKFSFVSTGGGAMLDFLANKSLPAVQALENI